MKASIQERPKLGLREIRRILTIPKKDRCDEDQEVLVKYLKKLKVFKDMLQGDREDYENLSGSLQLMEVADQHMLIEEGSNGDLFYIILGG